MPFVDPVVENLKEALQVAKYVPTLYAIAVQVPDVNRDEDLPALFEAVGLLANAVGEELGPSMQELVAIMLPKDLSETLLAAFAEIGKNVPSLLPQIQGRIFAPSFAI